jgi:uracil-DNA glycosylase family 4
MPRQGFFSKSELAAPPPAPRVPLCGACGLFRKCHSPKMPVSGRGRKKILLVAEAPGRDEDRAGRQFVGVSGQMLEEHLSRNGVDMRHDCWLTNALICRPPGNEIEDNRQVGYCRPNLLRSVEELRPEVIVLMGKQVVRSLIGHIFREQMGDKKLTMARWAGWQIPCQRYNAWLCPLYHPAAVLRAKEQPNGPALRLTFERHLRAACKLRDRPWDPVPDFRKDVEVILDPAAAAIRLAKYTGGAIAFDYETDRLKPDHPDARIVSCSVCWEGQETIAYPWHGEAVTATKKLLFNADVRKVGQNIKFEERWTRREFGRGVRGWDWDCMLASHCLDNRAAVTSLKFQAFVRLGQEDYSTHVSPYLEAPDGGGNTPNRIRRVDLESLLLYNGLDSLLEYKLWEAQKGGGWGT